jgi:hypothetical protein
MKNWIFSILTLLLITGSAWAQRIDEAQLKKAVYYLASPELEGRRPGTKGERDAAGFIVNQFENIGLQVYPGFDDFQYDFTYTYSRNPHSSADADKVESQAINILAYLDNAAAQTIIIGAHYDHLGVGKHPGTREEDPDGKIHFGADDNASGVAGVLALADYFTNNDRKENFNFVFACFSAEELGLLGSKDMAERLVKGGQKFNYMLNMDMIGRLNPDSRNLHASGIGTAAEWGDLFKDIPHTFNMVLDSSGTGGSDHTSFYLQDIPVIHFFSGIHSDYHKSSDTPDKINYQGQRDILEFIIDLIELTEEKPTLAFQKTKSNMGGASRFKVTLGIMPDYAWQKGGVKLDGVSEGKPAQKAGMQTGDIILQIGEFKLESMQDYMKVLSEYNPGDKVKALVKRNDKELKMDVTF